MSQTIDHVETLPQVVRLQVWHLDNRGQRRAVNKQLSEHLTNTSLFQDWIVTPAPARITRDHYVPIEVSSPAFLGTIGVPFPFHGRYYGCMS